MIIDRSIGHWITDFEKTIPYINATYLDDVAYHIYCQYRKNKIKKNITKQYIVIRLKEKVYNKFYDEAKIIIRKQKLEIIKTKIEKY